jgi:hypothetical protein
MRPIVFTSQRLFGLSQNHSPGEYLSRTRTDNDISKPIPLKIATVTNVSMLAMDVADVLGKNLAMAAVISLSVYGGLTGSPENHQSRKLFPKDFART